MEDSYFDHETLEKMRDAAMIRSDVQSSIIYGLCEQLVEALETLAYIAAKDDLLDANEEVFNDDAARRMQSQALYVLEKYA